VRGETVSACAVRRPPVLPHQCEKKRFFLQPASRQLQLAEKIDTQVFIQLSPG